MRENQIRTLWKNGGAVVNGWLAIPNAFAAETMAHSGWDSLIIDLQHDPEKPVVEAIDHILERAKAHGVVAGIHNGAPKAALARIRKGFQFVTVSSDARLMAAGAQQVVAAMRDGTRGAPPTSGY